MAYRDVVLTDSPADFYEMETSTGTDSGSGGRTLTLTGGITTGVLGNVGNGWSFNGTSGQATATSFPSITTQFSIEAWFKSPGNLGWSNDYPTFVRRDGTDIILLRGRGSNITGNVNPGRVEAYIAGTTVISPNRYDDGNWHHVILTVFGTAAKLYVDGAQVATATTTKSTYNFGTGTVFVGGNSALAAEYYKGTLDNVAIYTTAVNSTHVTDHYNAGLITSVTVDAEVPTMSVQTVEPVIDAHGKISSVVTDETWQNGVLYSTNASTVTVGGSTNDYRARFILPRTSISSAGVTLTSSVLWVYKDSGSGALTIGVYRGSGGAKQGAAIRTVDASAMVAGWNSINIAEIVQDAFDNNRANVEIILAQESGGSLYSFRSTEFTPAGSAPYVETYYSPAPLNVTTDVPTAAISSLAAQDVTVSAQVSTTFIADTPSVSVASVDTTVETSSSVVIDVTSATLSADTQDVTVETIVSPNVTVDLDTPSIAVATVEPTVSLPAVVDLDTPGTSLIANDVTIAVQNNAVVELDTPTITVLAVKPTDINGEPIGENEVDDAYFRSTMRTLRDPVTGYTDMWMRLNESSGTKVYNRVLKNDSRYETAVGTYQNVTIGQFNGPEGRRSVYFNGSAYIDVYDPANPFSNADEVFYSPSTLEFSFRTGRQNEYLMGGSDKSGDRPGTGISSYIGASEFWLKDGKLNFRAYRQTGINQSIKITDIIGFTNVADNEWHHVVINAGGTNAARGSAYIEFWIDGKLEIRRFAGVGGTSPNEPIETGLIAFGIPDQIGARGADYDGFTVPAMQTAEYYIGDMTEVVYRNNRILSEDEILMQYDNIFGHQPFYAETPKMTVKAVEATVKSNKTRVLVLDFQTGASMVVNQEWPGIGPKPGHDAHGRLLNAPPYEAQFQFGALRNSLGDNFSDTPEAYQFFNIPVRNNYLDPVTDNERVVDLDVDVNIDDYDIIAIGNFPQNDSDWAWYTGLDEYSTPPFVPGRLQVENLIGQVRQKVIDGKKLFVNDPTSAVMLGIIDRVEFVNNMRERVVNDVRAGSAVGFYDQRAYQIDPWAGAVKNPSLNPDEMAERYKDEHKNAKQRVRKLIPGLTDQPGNIVTEYIEWYNTDPMGTPPAQNAIKFADRSNGLQVGDEFYMEGADGPYNLDWFDNYDGTPTVASRMGGWLAAPMANVKVGTTVTSFASKVWNLNNEQDNPYRDYAISIAVQPGDQWNNQTVQGKVYVNFTESFTDFATYFDLMTKQVVNSNDPQHPQTPEQLSWDFSTYRGQWQGNTVNPNQASGGASLQTNTNGGIEAGTSEKPTKKPNIGTLVSFEWGSWWPLVKVEVPSMAHRGLVWLAGTQDQEGTASVAVETPTMSAKTSDVTVETVATTDVSVDTARVTLEAYNDLDTPNGDITVLVQTPSVSLKASGLTEVIDLDTPSISISTVEPEDELWNNIEHVTLTMPFHTLTLIMEDK